MRTVCCTAYFWAWQDLEKGRRRRERALDKGLVLAHTTLPPRGQQTCRPCRHRRRSSPASSKRTDAMLKSFSCLGICRSCWTDG
jgi:hypothetical protein